MRKVIKATILEILVVLLSLIVLIPFYLLVVNSFKNKAEAAEMSFKLPSKWNIYENYRQLIDAGNLLTGLKNSLILILFTIILSVLFASAAAFILQRRSGEFTRFVYLLFVIGLIVPSFIVPQILILRTLHIKSYVGAILLYVVGSLPLGIFLYAGYFKSIPRALDESAIIDGCGAWRMFVKIIFPLVKPVTVTFIIILFLSYWNDFATAIYIMNGPEKQTLTLTMYSFFGERQADWNLVYSCIVVASLPVAVLYLLLQRHVVSGMTAGAIKG